MLQHAVGINPETGLAFPFRAEMRPDVQASASVMRLCLRAEVFTKAGVCLVFNVLSFLYWLALPVSNPARNGCGTVYCFTDAYNAARVPAI
jgi:hypothetical protein